MKLVTVVGYRPRYAEPGRIHYVRVYKNGRQFVDRLHPQTATHFNTKADAQAAIDKFNLIAERAEIISVAV